MPVHFGTRWAIIRWFSTTSAGGGSEEPFLSFLFFFFFNRVGRKQSYCSEFSANQKSTKKHSGLLSFRCLDDYRMILSPLSRSDVALRRTVRAVCQSTCDVRTPWCKQSDSLYLFSIVFIELSPACIDCFPRPVLVTDIPPNRTVVVLLVHTTGPRTSTATCI